MLPKAHEFPPALKSLIHKFKPYITFESTVSKRASKSTSDGHVYNRASKFNKRPNTILAHKMFLEFIPSPCT